MVKRAEEQKVSPFDALRIARLVRAAPSDAATPADVARPLDVQTGEHPDIQTASHSPSVVTGLAKSRDPRYVKFTTYIPKDMHLKAKSRLVSQGRELSDLVAELLDGWLAKQLDI